MLVCAGLYTDGLCVEMRKEEMICISGLCDSVRVCVFYQFISISVLLVLVCILLACLCVCACVCACVCQEMGDAVQTCISLLSDALIHIYFSVACADLHTACLLMCVCVCVSGNG